MAIGRKIPWRQTQFGAQDCVQIRPLLAGLAVHVLPILFYSTRRAAAFFYQLQHTPEQRHRVSGVTVFGGANRNGRKHQLKSLAFSWTAWLVDLFHHTVPTPKCERHAATR